ncbi:MAG: phosphoglucosamine mutase [Bacteroidetes bacterium]|nr:phosphoglucosamine mutase [Bacteroidota bacterium]
MSLIKSISGIRGTIGGKPGEGLTPPDIVKYTAAFATFIRSQHPEGRLLIVIGRDARPSGGMVSDLISGTLLAMGADVLDIGLTTTPTTELAVTDSGAHGGIIITASHNPKQWNALKLLNHLGEFLSAADGEDVEKISETADYRFAEVAQLGRYSYDDSYLSMHIEKILDLPLVDTDAIKKARFSITVDAVNSSGGIAVPMLLKALGVNKIDPINCEPDGEFAHNPEPLPEHLDEICARVSKISADLGIVVDPDVDRLAIINEVGEPFGEEYTLVAVADYVLKHQPGNTVSNLSSTQALRIITEKAGGEYFASAVGEVNVVELMKKKKAVIGGEGNGGVIYPELHYGRDALVGIALFLTHLAKSGKTCSGLRDSYPSFFISKNRIEFSPEMDIDEILKGIIRKYKAMKIETIDGVKIHFEGEWVHMRKSNTENIIRIYAESDLMAKAENLAKKIINDFKEILNEKNER